MKTITNEQQLNDELGRITILFLENTAEKFYKEWYGRLEEDWYAVYEPKQYQRTEAILRSIIKTRVVRVGNKYDIEVYSDLDIMNQWHPKPDEIDGKDGEAIRDIIEKTGFSFGDVERKPAHAFEQAIESLRNSFYAYIKLEFKKIGKII